jgi:hypothetical protein
MSSPVKGGKDPNGPSTGRSQLLTPDEVYDFNVKAKILVPYSAAKVPKLLGDLPLSMLGRFDFRRNVPYPSHPGLYTVDTKGDQPMLRRLHAADLMFLTHGAAQSSSATTIAAPPRKFHEVQRNLYLETEDAVFLRAKRLRDEFVSDLEVNMFDSVRRSIHSSPPPSSTSITQIAAVDKACGSITFAVHIKGAFQPGAPDLPQFLKALVYLPRTRLEEIRSQDPHLNASLEHCVQLIIRKLGIPNKQIFDAAFRHKFKSASSSSKPKTTAKPYSAPTSFPNPINGSFVYEFVGRQVVGDADADCVDIATHNSLWSASNSQNSQYESAL